MIYIELEQLKPPSSPQVTSLARCASYRNDVCRDYDFNLARLISPETSVGELLDSPSIQYGKNVQKQLSLCTVNGIPTR